jgi:hypothetical protein
MCQLVTIGIPRSAAAVSTEFGGPRYGLAIEPSRNPHIARIFPATDVRLQITAGGCSCGLVGKGHGSRAGDEARQLRRYEKLGWSQAKIDRALQASATADARVSTDAREHQFRDGVLALLDRMPSVRVFVHMYSGDYDTELVVSKGAARVSRAEYVAGRVAIDEDVLVEISG